MSGEDLFGEPDIKEKHPEPASDPATPQDPVADTTDTAVKDEPEPETEKPPENPIIDELSPPTPRNGTDSSPPEAEPESGEGQDEVVREKPQDPQPNNVTPEDSEVKSKIQSGEGLEIEAQPEATKGTLSLISINISEFEKRKDYVVFKITCKTRLNPGMTLPSDVQTEYVGSDLMITIMRRYSDFELLRNYLIVKYPSFIIPPLPDKASTNYIMNKVFASDNSDFLSQRLSFLEIFLTRILRLTKLSKDIWFERFLFLEKWREEVQPEYITAGNLAKAHQSSFFSRNPTSPNPDMVEIANFCSKSQEFLTNLLKAYEKVKSTRQSMFHSTHDFGTVLQNWADIDSAQSEMFQYAAGTIDTFQDGLLKVEEDEEYKLVGPAKEYIAYSEAVKAAVKRQYSMAVAHEKAVETHKSKATAKDKADKQVEEATAAGKNLLKAEERQKLAITQLNEAQVDMDNKEKAVNEFTEEFLTNYQSYQVQRKVDFKAIFLNFSRSQFVLNNQNRESWEKIYKNFKIDGASGGRSSTS